MSSASEVTTVWRYRKSIIVIIICVIRPKVCDGLNRTVMNETSIVRS